MKKQILAIGIIGASLLAVTAKSSDPVLMNINGKDVRLSEFEYLYHKNNAQQVQPQTLDEYVDMFVDYKLKVADAEAAGIDTTATFVNEFTKFRNELADPYMVDQHVLDSIVAQSYEHMTNDVFVSHIMMPFEEAATLDSLRTAIVDGRAQFEEVAAKYSIDRGTSQQGGSMGWVGNNRYPWAFEEAAYNTAVGEISPVINSGFGNHIIRVDRRQPSRGEVLVEHILLLTRNVPDSVAERQKVLIDSLYNVAVSGNTDFETLATEYSQDPGSARRGGKLDWFGTGVMVAEFDSAAFATPVGAYSKPFKSDFGWHIIKALDSRGPASLEESRDNIIKSMSADERSTLPRRAYTAQMVKKYNGRMLLKNYDRLTAKVNELGGVYDSTMMAELRHYDLPIFEIAGKKYTVADVIPTMPVISLRGADNIVTAVTNAGGLLLGDKALELAREDLVLTNPEYRNLVNEYRDGILLFEISNRNVWQRAAENKDELEKYFQTNRAKYTWDAPKFKSYIIFASNDSVLNEAMAYAQTLPEDMVPTDLVKAVRDKFGRDVKVERVIAAKGENAITDYLAFGGEKPASDNARWPSYAAFRGRVISMPVEAADVRGQVVADYQAELERRWVESLRHKYPVKINKKVLSQVK